MTRLVSDAVLLIGKVAFLAVLYGFIYAVLRGLLAETRAPVAPVHADADQPEARPVVDTWELRAPSAAPPTLHPPALGHPAPLPQSPPQHAVPAEASGPQLSSEPQDVAGAPLQPTLIEPPEAPLPPEVEPAPMPDPEPAPAPPEEIPAALAVLTSPEVGLRTGLRLELGDATTLGRSDDSDIVLNDRFVSAQHAQIIRSEDEYLLRDLGSTNGTFRNGTRIQQDVVLQQGDRLGIGTSVFAFHERR